MRFLGLLAVGIGGRARLLDPGQRDPGTLGDGAGDQCARRPPLGPGQRASCRLALGHRGRCERVSSPGDRPLPFLDGTDLEPGFHLGGPRGYRSIGELLPAGGLGVAARIMLGRVCQPVLPAPRAAPSG